jgi:hypothetical protein
MKSNFVEWLLHDYTTVNKRKIDEVGRTEMNFGIRGREFSTGPLKIEAFESSLQGLRVLIVENDSVAAKQLLSEM